MKLDKDIILGLAYIAFWVLVGVFIVGGIFLLIFDRPLYCKIAMLGQINSVPAFCLKDVVKSLISH